MNIESLGSDKEADMVLPKNHKLEIFDILTVAPFVSTILVYAERFNGKITYASKIIPTEDLLHNLLYSGNLSSNFLEAIYYK
tara:strand:+ start:4642 stop:4887 length:246 start_codon:yes stop_codon:yes gene_type:complete